MTTSVLITNFNSWDLAARCVKACAAVEGFGAVHLVVVDDHTPIEPPND